MDFTFTEDQLLLQQTLRQFAKEKLLPNYARWDRGEKIGREEIREVAKLGVFGLRVPARFGGQMADYVSCGIMTEELSRGDFNYSLFIQLGLIASELLSEYAHPEVQAEWLPRHAAGEAVIGFGLTEPSAGSDAANITTRAVRSGDDYLVTGEKASITFAGYADACIVFARTGESGARGISAFLVPLDGPGVTRQVYKTPGERLTQRGSLFFDGVRIPARNRVGDERGGFAQAMVAFDFNRAVIALACVGAAQQSLDETIDYTKGRQVFGKPLAKFEGVAFQVAEHLTLIEAARLVSYKCLWLKEQGQKHTKEAAMAKWLGPKAAAEAIHACIILHGHYGYSMDLPLEQRWRDVVGLEIGDGTPEIMKGVIAREAFGREYTAYRD
ncbi:MAG: acyl-CoA dehydrogenase family protein [Deltaproteobacteria bacterium]|nr:acyl-CoA dehydrogenase family protein [Deltaproteobacteria bacterium]